MVQLACAREANTTLPQLNLGTNDIGDEATIAIALALVRHEQHHVEQAIRKGDQEGGRRSGCFGRSDDGRGWWPRKNECKAMANFDIALLDASRCFLMEQWAVSTMLRA